MVTATAFQILVSNNAPVKAVIDNAIITLEVSVGLNKSPQRTKIDKIFTFQAVSTLLVIALQFSFICTGMFIHFRGFFLEQEMMHPLSSSQPTMTLTGLPQ